MQFDIDKMAAADRYELLLGTVVPRPIALVTTLSSDGAINAAPYSLFNVVGHDPAVAMISVLAHPEGRLKDTAVDTPELKLIGGMHGGKWYAKLSDRFEMERPTWAEWVRQSEPG